jgi:hypothetical protein
LGRLLLEVFHLDGVETEHLEAVTAKQVYAELTTTLLPPKIEAKMPAIGWYHTWQHLQIAGLPPPAVDTMFSLLHNILPLRSRLHRMGQAAAACRRCDAAVEDQLHFFTACPRAADVWAYLATTVGRLLGGPLPDLHLLLLHLPLHHPLLLHVVLAVVVLVELVWATRDDPAAIAPQTLKDAVQIHTKNHLVNIFSLI